MHSLRYHHFSKKIIKFYTVDIVEYNGAPVGYILGYKMGYIISKNKHFI